jgi:hypothetical protein
MNKEFIPYEQALALKELGFDESCIAFWDGYNGSSHLFFKPRIKYHWLLRLFNRSPKEVSEITQYELEYLEGDNSVLAPLYQQAFRWLRENHELWQIVMQNTDKDWTYDILPIKGIVDYQLFDVFDTYEEAELECLKKLIELTKNK